MPRRVLVVIALCVLAGAACSSPSHKYTADTEGAFMESCTVRQGQPAPICKCTYDEISQQIPFDRYVELDKQLQADPNAVPDELIHIVADCGSRLKRVEQQQRQQFVLVIVQQQLDQLQQFHLEFVVE